MTSKLTREWLQHQISAIEAVGITDSNTLAAFKLALSALDSEPVAWRVSFTQIGHESNNFTKTYWDEEEKDRWVKLHKMSGFKVNVEPLYTVPPVLAALDSEPVMFCSEETLAAARDGEHLLRTLSSPSGECVIPLYRHAQPAKGLELAGWQFKSVNGDWLGLIDEHGKNQAVREGCEVREVFAMADGVNERGQVRHAQQQVVPECFVRFHDIIKERHHGRMPEEVQNAFNECAAMLQAGNSPVIPGWIPVSERLPEEGGRYWCYVEEQNSLGKSHYQWNCSWNGEIWGGAMMYGRVTHWMPLPNPPKE